MSPDAMAAVAEYGARCAGRRDRLITRYSEIGDLAREAAFQAGQARAKMVTRRHVDQALAMQRQRHDLAQELTERGYAAGYMELTTTGSAVGQINARREQQKAQLTMGGQQQLMALDQRQAQSTAALEQQAMQLTAQARDRRGSRAPVCRRGPVQWDENGGTGHAVRGYGFQPYTEVLKERRAPWGL